jgi:hypothetical protein
VDGKGAGEKQDIFPAEVLAFDPWEGVLHDQGTPTACADFAWFAACSLVRIERFTVVGELKNEFLGGFFDFNENLALASTIGVEVNIDEGFVHPSEDLASLEIREAGKESPLFGESTEALEARREELDFDQRSKRRRNLGHGHLI